MYFLIPHPPNFSGVVSVLSCQCVGEGDERCNQLVDSAAVTDD